MNTNTVSTQNNYWLGPFGIRIPNTINEVKEHDLCNTRYKNGSHTEMTWDFKNELTEAEYKLRFTTLGPDGYYYYKLTKSELKPTITATTNANNYWIGPCDIRIPNTINDVVDRDLRNRRYKNGSWTEMVWDDEHELSPDQYRLKFAVQGSDSNYYWK